MEETIDLRELIAIILKGKWIIASITIICVLLAGVVSWFVLPEKYQSTAVVQVESGVLPSDTDTDVLSKHVSKEFTPLLYTKVIQNEAAINGAFQRAKLNNVFTAANVTTTNEANTNLVNITYTSNSAQNAQQELQIVLETAKAEMNRSVQTKLKDLVAMYASEEKTLSKDIATITNDYNQLIRNNNLPEVLIFQTISNKEMTLNITDTTTKGLASVDGKMQHQLIQLQAQIQAKSEEYRKVLENYQSVKTGLDSFKSDPFIRVIAQPSLANGPASPNKMLNVAIGFVLGLMMSVGVVFFRQYWRDSAPVK